MKAAEFDQVLAIRLHRLGRDACLVHDVLVAAMADFKTAQELTSYMLTTPSVRAQRTIAQKYSQVALNVNQILQSL